MTFPFIRDRNTFCFALAPGEGFEPPFSSSKPDVLPIALSRKRMVDPAGLKPAPRGLKGRRSVTRAPDQDIADFLLPIADFVYDVTHHFDQKPIGNRQLAIGNDLAVAEGFEPSHGRINSAVPYQLGYATNWL